MVSMNIQLSGSTWDHVRGFDALPAAAQLFKKLYPNIEVDWKRRTLQEFAEQSVLDLAVEYDFIVLDHPWIGAAVERQTFLPLDEFLSTEFLADQAANSVGASHVSYQRDGHQWALAIDAASHVSAYRPDLFANRRLRLPFTWDDVLNLGRELQKGDMRIAMPFHVVDCGCAFLSLCANLGEPPMCTKERYVSSTVGRQALEMIRQLRDLSHRESFGWNPPQLLDRMAETDEIAYCPLLFGYSNYARDGFRRNLIRFANIPEGAGGKPSGSLLGGAGIAVSRHTRWPKEACEFAAFVASPEIQRNIYLSSGGQPGHRSAWMDEPANILCHNFFYDTLQTVDSAYVRPRFNGYISVQNGIAELVHDFLKGISTLEDTLDQVNKIYPESCELKDV